MDVRQAEDGLQDLQIKLTDLQKQLPDSLHDLSIEIWDEFRAVQNRVQAVKYDLIICVRQQKEVTK